MKCLRLLIVWVLACFLISGVALAGETLDEAVAVASKRNPEAVRAKEGLSAVDEGMELPEA